MVLSHTPLKMIDWLHNKHVLVSGQQNIKEIVKGYPCIFYSLYQKDYLLNYRLLVGTNFCRWMQVQDNL